jgi:iron complex outermembrane receptor protein
MRRLASLLAHTAVFSALAFATSPAFAQAPVPRAGADEEIIVTAQKRAERLIDVPISVTAVGGEALEDQNLTAATDLQYVAPGLGLGDANTPRGAGLRIRGIGTNVFADGIEQSVGTVVDGVPLARAGQGLADIVDIARIEVLRGPQGMLFGRNASAGLINIITRSPSETFGWQFNAAGAGDGYVTAAAAITGPIVEQRLAGRLSGYVNKRDGVVTNRATGQDLNNRDEHGLRGALRFTPTENLEFILRGDMSERDNRCCVWTARQFASAATDPRSGQSFLSSISGPVTASPNNLSNNAGGQYFNRVKSDGASAEVNWEVGDYTLTSITAKRSWSQQDNNDADLGPLNVLDRNLGGNDLDQFSQELRFTSPDDGPFDFVLGLFYFDSSNTGNFSQVGRFTIGLAQAQAAGIGIPLGLGLTLPAAQNFGRDVRTVIDVQDFAAFGQANWSVTPSLDIFAGGRFTSTEVAMQYARVGTPGANAFNAILGGAFAPLAFNTSTEDENFSWRIGAQYALGEDANIYATVARGYKGPGFNNLLDIVIPAGVTAQAFTLVEPEIPTAYELGYKASLFDRRLQVQAALFRTQFEDFQAQVVEQQVGTGLASFAIRNAGELLTQGFELQLTAAPTEAFTLDLGLTYANSTFESFTGASCPRAGALVTAVGAPCGPATAGGANPTFFDASGLDATNAPKWTISASGRYERALTDGVTGFAQFGYFWRDDVTFGLYPANIPNPTTQEAYGLLNASFGARFWSDRASLSIFGRNLTDENFVTSIFDLPFDANGGLGQFVTADAQRTIGLSLNIDY